MKCVTALVLYGLERFLGSQVIRLGLPGSSRENFLAEGSPIALQTLCRHTITVAATGTSASVEAIALSRPYEWSKG